MAAQALNPVALCAGASKFSDTVVGDLSPVCVYIYIYIHTMVLYDRVSQGLSKLEGWRIDGHGRLRCRALGIAV